MLRESGLYETDEEITHSEIKKAFDEIDFDQNRMISKVEMRQQIGRIVGIEVQ